MTFRQRRRATRSRRVFAVAAGAVVLGCAAGRPLEGQSRDLLYDPGYAEGDIVAPYFDGWTENPDGTYTLLFGFMNLNEEEVVEIPLGPDNFIEPREFDGLQPTSFPVLNYGGDTGKRERNAFAITVPADFQGRDVVWTLRHRGRTASVPGRVTVQGYQLSTEPQSAGSLRPMVTFAPDDPGGTGPVGVFAEQSFTTRVNQPLTVTFWAQDRGEREPVPLSMTWFKHQGPGVVEFSPAEAELAGDMVTSGSTTATFKKPGEYVLRVRVDNFDAVDSGLGQICCWTNGFVRVAVTP